MTVGIGLQLKCAALICDRSLTLSIALEEGNGTPYFNNEIVAETNVRLRDVDPVLKKGKESPIQTIRLVLSPF